MKISVGEYYRVQFCYLNNEEITYGGVNLDIDVSRDRLLDEVKSIYERYKHLDVRIELLRVKAEAIPLEIKPVQIEFKLGDLDA